MTRNELIISKQSLRCWWLRGGNWVYYCLPHVEIRSENTRWATIISHTHTPGPVWKEEMRANVEVLFYFILFNFFCSVFLNKPHRTVTQNAPRYSDPCGLLSLWSRSSFWRLPLNISAVPYNTVIKLAALFLKAVRQHTHHTTAALCGSRNHFFHPFGVPIRLGCAASVLEED